MKLSHSDNNQFNIQQHVLEIVNRCNSTPFTTPTISSMLRKIYDSNSPFEERMMSILNCLDRIDMVSSITKYLKWETFVGIWEMNTQNKDNHDKILGDILSKLSDSMCRLDNLKMLFNIVNLYIQAMEEYYTDDNEPPEPVLEILRCTRNCSHKSRIYGWIAEHYSEFRKCYDGCWFWIKRELEFPQIGIISSNSGNIKLWLAAYEETNPQLNPNQCVRIRELLYHSSDFVQHISSKLLPYIFEKNCYSSLSCSGIVYSRITINFLKEFIKREISIPWSKDDDVFFQQFRCLALTNVQNKNLPITRCLDVMNQIEDDKEVWNYFADNVDGRYFPCKRKWSNVWFRILPKIEKHKKDTQSNEDDNDTNNDISDTTITNSDIGNCGMEIISSQHIGKLRHGKWTLSSGGSVRNVYQWYKRDIHLSYENEPITKKMIRKRCKQLIDNKVDDDHLNQFVTKNMTLEMIAQLGLGIPEPILSNLKRMAGCDYQRILKSAVDLKVNQHFIDYLLHNFNYSKEFISEMLKLACETNNFDVAQKLLEFRKMM